MVRDLRHIIADIALRQLGGITLWQVIFPILFCFPLQSIAQNDSVSLQTTPVHAESDSTYHQSASDQKVKVFVVKGTTITSLQDNKKAEIIYIDKPSENKVKKEIPQPEPKKEITKPEEKREKVNREKPKPSIKPYPRKHNRSYLISGSSGAVAVVNVHTASKKPAFSSFTDIKPQVHSIGFLSSQQKHLPQNQQAVGFLYADSLSIRPPPAFC